MGMTVAGALLASLVAVSASETVRVGLSGRDPGYVRRSVPFIWPLIAAWFCPEVRGMGRIPATGPVLLVGNHSGGNVCAAARVHVCLLSTLWRRAPFFQLAHRLVM